MAKILIVDDEPGMRAVLSDFVEKQGYESLTAKNSKQTFEIIETNQVDLVLLDIDLVVESGVDILRQIKRIYQNLPVIMCSGLDNITLATESLKIGAVDYIRKPFDNKKVIEKIKKALQVQVKIQEKEIKQPAAEEVITKAVITKEEKKPAIKVKSIWMLTTFIVLIGLIIFLSKFMLFKRKKWTVYEVPYSNPTSLSWSKMDGKEYLWVSDWLGQNIYKHNLDNSLSISKVYHFPKNYPSGLASGLASKGFHIWSSDVSTNKIYNHVCDENLTVSATYKSPGPSPIGLCWDGTYLWSCDADRKKIYKHRVDDNLSVVNVYDSPASYPVDLFWDGENIWSADADTNKVYKHNMDDSLSVANEYQPGPLAEGENKISGLTWDGKNIWFALEGTGKICKYSKFSLK